MTGRLFRVKLLAFFVLVLMLATTGVLAKSKPCVGIDQDAMGQASTDTNSILVFLQSPNVHLLGVTVVTGDGWLNEEVAHMPRLLELMGRSDNPVIPGRNQPMVRTKE